MEIAEWVVSFFDRKMATGATEPTNYPNKLDVKSVILPLTLGIVVRE